MRPRHATRQDREPRSGIVGVSGTHDGHPELANGETCATYCVGRKGTMIEIAPFDKQVGETRSLTQPSDLGPEPAARDREVQVADVLPLDEHPADRVIACTQRRDRDVCSACPQSFRDAALQFEDVGHDRCTIHAPMIASEDRSH